MSLKEREELARICRGQAAITASPEVRHALLDLADRYLHGDPALPLAEGEAACPPPRDKKRR